MLLYINSQQDIPIGAVIEIPNMCVLFQERVDAVVDRKLESIENNKEKSYTFKVIIDEPIHDPLIQVQNDSIYVPNDIGLFHDHRSGGLAYEEFIKKITNINDSKDIYLTEALLNQIKDIGFKGVWIFDNGKRNVITVEPISGLVIGSTK
tara:strand:- start:445 stop:894 length:450 start_codon:yes stop_codon:yes gene_type:complete